MLVWMFLDIIMRAGLMIGHSMVEAVNLPYKVGLGMEVECRTFEIGLQRFAMAYMGVIGLWMCTVLIKNKAGLCWSMVFTLNKVGRLWSMEFFLDKLGLSLSMVNIMDTLGLLLGTVIILAKLGLLMSMDLFLTKIGLLHRDVNFQATVGLALRMVVSGDHLTVDPDALVTFHGMMWGEVEWEMESFLGAPMAHGRRAQDP